MAEIDQIRQLQDELAERDAQIADMRQSIARFRLLIDGIRDYAIFMIDQQLTIISWGRGAERVHGYHADEIIGRPFSQLYPDEDVIAGTPRMAMERALTQGHVEEEGLRLRNDGSSFWANMVATPLFDHDGAHLGFSVVVRDITQRKQAEEMIRYHAYHDALTGLPNRAYFNEQLSNVVTQAQRTGVRMAILFFDLDRFKLINDTLGHAVGDLLLKAVARRLSVGLRPTDILIRLGGDEFIMVVQQMHTPSEAIAIADRIIDALTQPFDLKGHDLYISTSIGLSFYPGDGDDLETLLKNADIALYRAKDQGRGNYQLFTPDMHAHVFERLSMENHLRKALEHGDQLLIYYQPQINLRSGELVSLEALLRWNHPFLGLLGPDQFMPLADEVGLTLTIEEWVLRQATAEVRKLLDAGFGPLRVAVNLSLHQVRRHNLAEIVGAALQGSGIPPAALELEIAESIAMQSESQVTAVLRQLHEMGVRISIDDFGTGYSSFSYLKRTLVDAIKIDHSFVNQMDHDQEAATIAGSIVRLAHDLELEVVAEGVETQGQLAQLRALGCDLAQGYLLSHPLPPQDLRGLLERWRNESPWKPT